MGDRGLRSAELRVIFLEMQIQKLGPDYARYRSGQSQQEAFFSVS